MDGWMDVGDESVSVDTEKRLNGNDVWYCYRLDANNSSVNHDQKLQHPKTFALKRRVEGVGGVAKMDLSQRPP